MVYLQTMKALAFLLVFLSAITGYTQSVPDSLRARLAKETTTQKKIVLVDALAEAFFTSSQYDSLNKYGQQLFDLSEQVNSNEYSLLAAVYMAQSFARSDSALFFKQSKTALQKSIESKNIKAIGLMTLGLGSRLLTLGQYNESLTYLMQGYDAIDLKSNDTLLGIKSDLIRTVSAVFHHQGKYTEALEHALTSSRLAEMSRVRIQILKSYLNLSGLYGELSSPDNGLGTPADRARYHIEAKKYMRKSYEYSILNASLLTQGATAFNLGALYTEDGVSDSANYYLNEAIRLGKQTGFNELLSNAYRSKSTLNKTRPDTALYYLDLAAVHARQAKNPISEVSAQLEKAKILTQLSQWEEAQQLANKALQSAVSLRLLNDKRSAYKLLYEINQHKKNYAEALNYYRRYEEVKDSIVNEKNYARIEELKATYESELKDSEIKNLEQKASLQQLQIRQQQLWLIGISILIVLAVGAAYLYYRQRALKQKQRELETENKLLRLQLDPHFLSNALVSIQRFMLENNTTEASNYLTKFSKLMRQLLEHSRQELITVENEIDLLRNYLDIQKLRFKDRFNYQVKQDESLAISDWRIPPMLAQPFVENAIEHGIGARTQGMIHVSFLKRDNQLLIEILDDGPGIAQMQGNDHKSLSTTIIQERIAILNQSHARPIQLNIGTGPEGKGTLVTLSLPIYS